MKNEKKIIFFAFFQKNIEKCRKKWKMMKMGKILMKEGQNGSDIDEKWKK